MSGGSMDYLYQRLADAEFKRDTPLRRAFARHLAAVAEALHEIEWADSGDTTPGEEDVVAIRACLGKRAELEQLVNEARELVTALQKEIKRAAL